nr:ATP-binding region and DNA mismatch repair protein and MutL domain containing protein [Haemonchus contortus]
MFRHSNVRRRGSALEHGIFQRGSRSHVIVSLGCAVRQLIDNSLDASAQSIEIRARNNGYESVEIIDDGTGIESDNFDSLCKPHSTSKLSGLNDFGHLSTLGFRGEALNALCALASITLITRHRSDHLGTKLRFDHSGNIIESVSAARSVGATVIVENLFETLPVRRKEFERTSKKEFSKVLATVQSFALSRPDIKFVCNNTVAGKRQQLICTPGNATIRDVVINLFGGRTDKNKMVDIVRCLPNDEVCSNYGLDPKNTEIYADYSINGFVSSCEHGFGRSAADRQFVYVNQRPVDYAKICRVVNEVYQQYNRSQYPTLVLNIEVPPGMIDVNVTPDKRMVFFEREKELLALIRSSMLATFHPLLGAYTSVEDSRSKDDESRSDILNSNSNAPLSAQNALFSLLKSNSVKTSSPAGGGPAPKKSKTDSSFAVPKGKVDSVMTLDAFAFKPISRENSSSAEIAQSSSSYIEKPESSKKPPIVATCTKDSSTKKSKETPKKGLSDVLDEFSHEKKSFNPSLMRDLSRGFENNIEKDRVAIEKMETTMDREECGRQTRKEVEVVHHERVSSSASTAETVEKTGTFLRTQQTISFSMSALKERLNNLRATKAKEEQASQEMEFHAGLSPSENELAEKELDRTLKKSDFNQMSVIGQFNKGFIITRLRNHLFLIDQHASDEKFNFERFQKKARVETQRLIQPQLLDIGAVQASVLKDNLNILEANGFGFEFKDGADGCTVPLLVSTPVLHSWQFDKSDIEEILTVVSEFPGVMYRPAKLRRIFASRACRKSVMIGTTLTTAQMQTIVRQLSTLDQPWNCPHGRPTLRHLVDLQNMNTT